jgi:hypothetical protein
MTSLKHTKTLQWPIFGPKVFKNYNFESYPVPLFEFCFVFNDFLCNRCFTALHSTAAMGEIIGMMEHIQELNELP